MTRITAILNQKGGVAKTTTAHALTSALTLTKHRTLAVDADAQSDLSHTMRGEPNAPGIYEAMKGEFPNIQHVDNGDLLAANFNLFYADREFQGRFGYETIKDILAKIPPTVYDHVIIDCPPNLGVMVETALEAANDVIIPVQPAEYATFGLGQLLSTIEQIKRKANPQLNIAGILFTLASKRTSIHRAYMEDIRKFAEQSGIHVYNSVIYSAVAIQEAQALNQSLYETTPRAAVAKMYADFTREYLLQEL